MADEQVSLTSLVLIVVLGGLVIRYLFFPSSAAPSGAQQGRDAAASSRAREAAVERIQQVLPQADRRTILWELQRNRGNMAMTTERILTGRAETPPVSFQPPPAPASTTASSASQPSKAPLRPIEPDLITRYKLQDKMGKSADPEPEPEPAVSGGKTKAWSSNREERQMSLQRRRDEMILAARRKMEAKIATERSTTTTTS
ncbi:hypothetical protein F5B22DRAFT_362114 [Xylaria bambusicola]|uniref:uncharacterized protein n=1 Tax=Xylaria bambusicola TaxID=326684 RepID=UPI00200879DF|nr:uncharacterized protein F5B22DRAFT_362114 [Xylaria bambusicola]KAI0509357.1 hypothetical protein F5B22DRAFT_362114 [Xylaria bambusicola]